MKDFFYTSKKKKDKNTSSLCVVKCGPITHSVWCSVVHQLGPGERCSPEWHKQHCEVDCPLLCPRGVGRHWHQRTRRSWLHCPDTAPRAGSPCAGHPQIYCHHHLMRNLQTHTHQVDTQISLMNPKQLLH